ncbi:MAG: hypothetical protein A2734_03010 [Parcubacteria group bacterium RIFCSPHIGHO2_01_FULL_40_30]|nr:MAG: hypothetical protein A2734_03010 [Parcubacteria group bacterium RIFCSPHIGHO2_01_FULL_40_30]
MNTKQTFINKNQIELAEKFASEKFAEAGVKNHFLEVSHILRDELGVKDQDILIAGILHDTLEDTSATYEEIEKTLYPRTKTRVLRKIKNHIYRSKTYQNGRFYFTSPQFY